MRSSKTDEEEDDDKVGDEGGVSSREEEEEGDGEDSYSEGPRKKRRKYKREKPPRSKDWDDKSIRILISEYGARFAKSEEISERATEENRKVWKEITRKLRKSGYSFSVKSARRKWDTLESVYVDMASHNVHPGLKRITCPYGRELTAILNPGGMKNYMQIEEEEQKEQEKARKEKMQMEESGDSVEERGTKSVAARCIVRNMMVKQVASNSSTSSEQRATVRSVESDSDVIALTSDQSDDDPRLKTTTFEVPANMQPNVILQKTANYVEFAQSEPVCHPVQPMQPNPSTASEDMVLGIACQMYRHFTHHQHGNRVEPRGGQASGEVHGVQQHGSHGEGSSTGVMVHVSDNGGVLALQRVIERLMLEKERKLALLEERNEIDRQRIALDQTRMRLMEQLIALVSNRRT